MFEIQKQCFLLLQKIRLASHGTVELEKHLFVSKGATCIGYLKNQLTQNNGGNKAKYYSRTIIFKTDTYIFFYMWLLLYNSCIINSYMIMYGYFIKLFSLKLLI